MFDVLMNSSPNFWALLPRPWRRMTVWVCLCLGPKVTRGGRSGREAGGASERGRRGKKLDMMVLCSGVFSLDDCE